MITWDEWEEQDDYDDRDEYCDHDDYDMDILDGECRCHCGHIWYASNEQIEAEIERQARYHDDMEREERWQWWRDLFAPIRRPYFAIRNRLRQWRFNRKWATSDDEIPF